MRKIIALVAALLAASPALAQQFPTTFPPNTVYGRLGFQAGPGQAIPISGFTFWGLNANGSAIYNTNTGNVGIGVGSSTPAGDTLDVVGSITTRRTLATDMGGTLKLGHGAYQWQFAGNQITGGDLLLKNPGGTTVLAMPQTGGCLGVATGGVVLPTCAWAVDIGAGAGNAGIRINGGGFVAGQGPVLTFQQNGNNVGQLGTDCYLVSSPCNTDLVLLGLNSSRMYTMYKWGGVNVLNTASMNPTTWVGGALNVRTENSNNLVGGNAIVAQSTDDSALRDLPVAITSHMISLQAGNSDWGIYAHCDMRVAGECATIEGSAANTQGTPNDPPAASASLPTMPFNSALKMTCGQTLSNALATHFPCSVGLWGKYYLGNGGQQFRTGIWLDEGFASNTGILVNATSTQSATTSAEFRNSGSGKALVLKTMGAGVSTNHAFEVQNSGGSAVFWVNNAGAIEVDNGGVIQGITNFSLANAGTGAFNLRLRANTTMTANRTLDFAMDTDRTITLGGNLSLSAGVTFSGPFVYSGGSTFTLSTSGVVTLTASTTSIGQGQYLGTATNDNATAGNIGEFVSATLATGSAVSLTTATAATITSISLTAGDWDVTGVAIYKPAASTTVTEMDCDLSTTAATYDGTVGSYATTAYPTGTVLGTSVVPAVACPAVRKSLSGTTTVYLIAFSSFGTSTNAAYGFIRARRVR